MHEGHRLRMYEKLKSYPAMLADHEVLEILLFNALPRQNSNPLAHRLLEQFGSLPRILAADVNELMQVDGMGAQLAGYLKCVGVCFEKYQLDSQTQLPTKYDMVAFTEHLKEVFKGLEYEVFYVYVFDNKRRFLCRKTFTSLQKEVVDIAPKALTSLITEYAGKKFVLAHNHVVGKTLASVDDDNLTMQFQLLCSISNSQLLDHVIVGKDGKTYSYYETGRMAQISKDYNINQVVKIASEVVDE